MDTMEEEMRYEGVSIVRKDSEKTNVSGVGSCQDFTYLSM